MTENTPDAVEEIAAIIRDHSSKPYSDQASRNAAKALLGARAMQDAMAGRVRVKALEWIKPPLSETMRKCETPLGTYRTWTHHEADGQWFWSFEFGMMTEQGKGASEAEVQAAAQAHRSSLILSALEPAGGQEGAEDQPPSGAGLEDDISPVEAMAIACGMLPPALNLHDAYAREKAAKDVRTEHTPAPDVPGLVRRLRYRGQRWAAGQTGGDLDNQAADALEALQAEVAKQLGRAEGQWAGWVKADCQLRAAEARATAAEAERDALKAEVERKDKALVGAFEFAGRARGTALGLAMSGKDNPKLDSSLMKMHEDGLEVERTIRAALAPAKAGG